MSGTSMSQQSGGLHGRTRTDSWFFRDGESVSGPGRYDAGHGVSYTPYYGDAACTQLVGLMMWHPCPLSEQRGFPHDEPGVGPNARTGAAWGYQNTDDPAHITLIGSVLDPECGWHGFIRNGRWEPC